MTETQIDTRKMAARDERLADLIGRTARTPHGVGVIDAIAYNLYPVVRFADGRTWRAGSALTLLDA